MTFSCVHILNYSRASDHGNLAAKRRRRRKEIQQDKYWKRSSGFWILSEDCLLTPARPRYLLTPDSFFRQRLRRTRLSVSTALSSLSYEICGLVSSVPPGPGYDEGPIRTYSLTPLRQRQPQRAHIAVAYPPGIVAVRRPSLRRVCGILCLPIQRGEALA